MEHRHQRFKRADAIGSPKIGFAQTGGYRLCSLPFVTGIRYDDGSDAMKLLECLMFRTLLTASMMIAAIVVTVVPASAASDDDVTARIEALHGNAGDLAEPLLSLVEAMGNDDAETIASLAEYPLQVNANGETYDIQNAQDFVENYNTLLTDATKQAVAAQQYGDLFVNSDGVMLANGAVWMGAICEGNDCSSSHWAIIAINN